MVEFLTLLVDDDEDDREIFELGLAETGLPVKHRAVSSGTEVLELLQKEEDFFPDIIFLDFNMPLMDGSECLAEIKKLDRVKNIPVYIFTTSSGLRMETELIEKGASGFMTKPSRIKSLANMLEQVLIPLKKN